MGVGKTTVSQQLKDKLNNSVFLDGDWCWDASPFQVTEETKLMVQDNIYYILNNFIHCNAYENVIFCWVMHEQSIIDCLVDRLDIKDCKLKIISLLCDRESLKSRIERDVKLGLRTSDGIEKSLKRIPLYQKLDTIKVNTTGKSVAEVVEEIINL